MSFITAALIFEGSLFRTIYQKLYEVLQTIIRRS